MSQPVFENSNALTPAGIATAAEKAMAVRPVREKWRIAMLSVLGGAWIAIGFVFYVTSQTGMKDVPFGASKVLGGLVFSVGLILVVITGADLFTSTTMTIIAKYKGLITWSEFLIHWVIVWVFNFIGALLVVAMCYYGDLQNNAKGAWGKVILTGADTKLHHTWMQAFVLGIFANLAVCLAVWMAWGGKTVADKILAIVLPVAFFVATGLEHSVANMFFLPYAAFLKFCDPFTTKVDMSAFPNITWENIFVNNLLPVTLGNIIGGGLICGLYQYYANRPAEVVESAKA